MSAESLLEVDGLVVAFPDGRGGRRSVVDGVSFSIGAGERVGLVGPSGSGKSLTSLAILDLVPEPGELRSGTVTVDGQPAAGISRFRGGVVGLVLQEAGSALNPVFSVGFQLIETLESHGVAHGDPARERAVELLVEVSLDEPRLTMKTFPHQLSGGQAQRVMIALALAGEPKFLLADEPTTALDVITQARILELLVRITDDRGLGLLLVSHDLAVISNVVHRLVVMHDGRVVEEGTPDEVFGSPGHPCTRRLVGAARRREGNGSPSRGGPA